MVGGERPRRESFWPLRSGETGVHSSRAIDQEQDAGANTPYVNKFQDTVTALPLPFLLSALNQRCGKAVHVGSHCFFLHCAIDRIAKRDEMILRPKCLV
jgi:hypothetical protein